MKRNIGVLLMALAPLIVISATVYTMMLPNTYSSTTRILLRPSGCENPCPHCQCRHPASIRVEMEVMRSSPMLRKVAMQLDLQNKWGNDQKLPLDIVTRILRNSLRLSLDEETGLISITVQRNKPVEAAAIANAVAGVYQLSRMKQDEREWKVKFDALHSALENQQKKVDEAIHRVEEIRMTIGEPPKVYVDDLQMQRIQTDQLQARQEMNEKQIALKELEAIDEGDLFEKAQHFPYEPVISNLLQQEHDVEALMRNLDESYGPNHPEVVRLTTQKEQVHKTLLEQLLTLRKRFQTEYDIARNKTEKLDELANQIKSQIAESESEKYQPYRKAVADLENERFIYDQISKRYRDELPDKRENPVKTIDRAEPNLRPVSPNLFFNTSVAVIVAGVIATIGIVLMRT